MIALDAARRATVRALLKVGMPAASALGAWLGGQLTGRQAVGSALVGTWATVSTWLEDPPGARRPPPPPPPDPTELEPRQILHAEDVSP